ncbi:transforming acidic coiled-coil-containing protein 2 isoform X2 [Mixophyes fleayi]|uniref:transforming acidic coiled-coil-containing protein 2 isoform X2 n=1 Tax=Mixophyes fleayi TaxID=3061075 RepID=UPI003F4D8402
MGNDNSHNKAEPQIEPPAGPTHSDPQHHDEGALDEFFPSVETIPVLYPQRDLSSQLGGQHQGDETFPSLFSENLRLSAANPGSIPSQPSAWEEGQLRPALPQTGLYIEGLEYKESGSSTQPGTISVLSSEESREDEFEASQDIGLVGILREWGQQVLPEKIPRKSDEELKDSVWMPWTKSSSEENVSVISNAFNLQAQGKSTACTELLDNPDIDPDSVVFSMTQFNNNDTLNKDNWNFWDPSIQPLTATPQLIPAPLQVLSRNAAASQPDTMLRKPDDTCNQTTGDSRDSITGEGEDGLWNNNPLTTDGGSSQLRSQGNLILPTRTDGSSDRNENKLSTPHRHVPETLLHSRETPAVQSFEPNPVVSELSVLSDNLVTSLLNQHSAQPSAEEESILTQTGEITACHSSAAVPSETSDDNMNLNVNLKEVTSIENIQPQSTIQETSSDYGVLKKFRTDGGDFSNKDVVNHEPTIEALKDVSENLIPSDLLNKKSFHSQRTHESGKVLCTPNDITDIGGDTSLGIGFVPYIYADNSVQNNVVNDRSDFKENQDRIETPTGSKTALSENSPHNLQILSSGDQQEVINKNDDIMQTVRDNKTETCVNNLFLEDVTNVCIETMGLNLTYNDDIAKRSPMCSHEKACTSPSISEIKEAPKSQNVLQYNNRSEQTPLCINLPQQPNRMDLVAEEKSNVKEYVANDIQRTDHGKLACDNVGSATHQKKAAETDIKNTYLSISACPTNLGHSPATHTSLDKPVQSLSAVFLREEVHRLPPQTEPYLPLLGLESAMDREHLASLKEEKTSFLLEKTEKFPAQTKMKISQIQSGTDMCLNASHQRQSSDINSSLELSVLSDVERLNLKTNCSVGESSKVQLMQDASVVTPEHLKVINVSRNLEGRSTKEEEVSLITLNQKEKASSEDTPHLTSDKFLCPGAVLENKLITSNLQEHPIACTSDSSIIGFKMDKPVSKTCNETDKKLCFNGIEVTGASGLQKETTVPCSEPDVSGFIPVEKQSLKLVKENQSSKYFGMSPNANDTASMGIQPQLKATEDTCSQLHMQADICTLPQVPADTGIQLQVPADTVIQLQVPADTGTLPQVQADTGSLDQVPAYTDTLPQVPADTGSLDQVPADTGSLDQVPAYTDTLPQVPADTGTLPQVKADTGTLPQVLVDTGTLPQVTADTGTLPQVTADTGTLPQVPADRGTLPQVPADTGIKLQVPADTCTLPQVQADTGTLPQVPADTGIQLQVPADTGTLPQVPADTGIQLQVPADTGTLPQVPADTGTLPQVPADTGTLPQVPADTDTQLQVQADTGTLPQVQADTVTLLQIQADICTMPHVPADTDTLPQVPADTDTLPQVSADTGTLPQVPADTGTLPQVSADTGTLPQVSADTGSLPHVPADTGTLPEVPADTCTLPQVPADTDTQLQISADTCSTVEVSHKDSTTKTPNNDKIHVGNTSKLAATSPCQGENGTDIVCLSLESELLQIPILTASDKNLQLSLPCGYSGKNESPVICPEGETRVCTDLQIMSGQSDIKESLCSNDLPVEALGKTHEDLLQVSPISSIGESIHNNCNIQHVQPLDDIQRCYTEGMGQVGHGDQSRGIQHDEHVSTCSFMTPLVEELQPPESSDVSGIVVGQQYSKSDFVPRIGTKEQAQPIKMETYEQMGSTENIAEYSADNLDMSLQSASVSGVQKDTVHSSQMDSNLAISQINSHHLETEPFNSRSKFSDRTHPQCVNVEKSEGAFDFLHHNIHKEIPPQEKHPEMACEGMLGVHPKGTEVMNHNSQEHIHIHTDDVIGTLTGREYVKELSILADTISITDSDPSSQVIYITDSDSSSQVKNILNTASESQVVSMQDPACMHQATSNEEFKLSLEGQNQPDLEVKTVIPQLVKSCKEAETSNVTAAVSNEAKVTTGSLDLLPKEKDENFEDTTLKPQINSKELISDHQNLSLEEKEMIASETVEERSNLTVKGISDVPEIKETTIIHDQLHPTHKKMDILSEMLSSTVKETEILCDEPHFTAKETNHSSQAISPPTDDFATLAQAVTPVEINVTQETIHVPVVDEQCGPSSAGAELLQEETQIQCMELSTSIKQGNSLSGQLGNHHTADNEPLASSPAPDSEVSSCEHGSFRPTNDKLVSLPNEPASCPMVIRSPTFPTSDAYSFTQKLRSVLHSDRPFTKKTVTPTSPEPLVLPSSPRLFAKGAINERSSDSEEAFETPESTTPVKSAPPVPIPTLPEVQEQQPQQRQEEETPQLPPKPEEPDLVPSLESTQATDVTISEDLPDSPFRQPSRSFSVVFDEDKPIASSGTYNLDLVNAELAEANSSSSEAPAKTRRRSTDSVPVSRNTLSRSLSLQAADFQLEDILSSHGGSDSACSTLRRTKKARPASLKKKAGSIKKQTEAVSPKDTSEALSGESQEAEVDTNLQGQPGPSPPQTDADLPLVGEQQISSISSSELSSVEPQLDSGISVLPIDHCPAQETGRLSPPIPTHQKLEVAPSGPEVLETPAVIGQAVRLEFDYSEEAREGQPPARKGKKPSGKMPLRKPKPKKAVEKPDAPPGPPSPIPTDSDDVPISKGSYTYNMDQWDDPNFNPFSSSGRMPDPPSSAQEPPEPCKPTAHRSESPAKTPASFEIPTGVEQNGESNKPAKKKKTPLKTDTFRVKKSPKRSPVTENGSEELTLLSKSDAPPVIVSEEHATDEEKLASSVSSQKWTCMAVDLEPEKQDYPQPSDLTSFVNENQFLPASEDLEYGNSFSIEYMEKTGKCSPLRDVTQTQSMYLMFEASQDSPGNTLVKFSDSCTPGTDSSFEGMEPNLCSGQLPIPRSPPMMQDTRHQPLERLRQREDDPGVLGSGKMELGSPDDEYLAAETLLSRISHHTALCDQLSYLEPDLAEKNPQAFAQKLQEELEFAAMRIEALKLARHISQGSQYTEVSGSEGLDSTDVGLSHKSLYSRAVVMETSGAGLLHAYQQPDFDTALQLAREEIVAKEREAVEWKKKYDGSRCEVVEMRKIVAEYEQTIAQMIEDEQREKSVSHHTVQQLILEKEQALADLNSVEKSLADLFRRYEKMKDVLEGFRKNEEVLKKCAQEYLARVKKEEQRYHALKIHAEEKLDRANSDIAQVRSKSQQEQAAYQASLRKEQLKVDALERTLEQKNKEIEELTKICDELIAKMGKS